MIPVIDMLQPHALFVALTVQSFPSEFSARQITKSWCIPVKYLCLLRSSKFFFFVIFLLTLICVIFLLTDLHFLVETLHEVQSWNIHYYDPWMCRSDRTTWEPQAPHSYLKRTKLKLVIYFSSIFLNGEQKKYLCLSVVRKSSKEQICCFVAGLNTNRDLLFASK